MNIYRRSADLLDRIARIPYQKLKEPVDSPTDLEEAVFGRKVLICGATLIIPLTLLLIVLCTGARWQKEFMDLPAEWRDAVLKWITPVQAGVLISTGYRIFFGVLLLLFIAWTVGAFWRNKVEMQIAYLAESMRRRPGGKEEKSLLSKTAL